MTGKLQLAAEASNISQPAASRILSDIETNIGVSLFIRGPKGMVSTQAGQAFLRHSRSILSAYQNLEKEVVSFGNGQRGKVKIGSVTGPSIQCLVPAIIEIKKQSPLIEPTLEVAPSSQLVRSLEQGDFDFVIARMPAQYDSRAFHLLPARSEIMSFVVRKNHPLADQKEITLKDLSEYDWTIQEQGSPIRTALEQAFADEGVQMPAHITNTSSSLVMLGLLENSDTIATFVDEVAQLLTGGGVQSQLRVLDLENQILVAPYYIIRQRNRELSQIAERVIKEILKHF